MNVMQIDTGRLLIALSIILVLLFSLCATSSADSPKTRIALYMVGSDLESESSLGTEEIKEILSGLSGDSGVIDLQVAYGGSRTMGWSGMTFADRQALEEDLRDGIVGNGQSYQFRDPSCNMGDSAGLIRFIEYLNELPESDRNISRGLCFDENHHWDRLTMTEISDSLSHSNISWDLIGMDACLMGSLEVMNAVNLYGRLLLVSEEVEPGHGWDYETPLHALIQNPAMPIEEWGRLVIDSYMDNPSHEPMKKTLSLIDMTQIHDLNGQLSLLGTYLDSQIGEKKVYEGIGTSFYNAQRFGYDPKNDVEVSVDLGDLSANLENNVPQSSAYVKEVKDVIEKSVLYQRNDGSRAKSTGISTVSPRNKHVEDIPDDSNTQSENATWSSFIQGYLKFIASDTSKPLITPLGNGTFQVSDDQGIQMVMVKTDWMPEVTNFTHSYGMKADPVYPDSNGLYVPNPDDKTFYLTDTGTGNRSYFFNTYYGNDLNETEYYYGFVNITRRSKTRETAINIMRFADGSSSYALFPYETDLESGELVFSRVPLTVRSGDIITPVIVERFLGEESRWQYSPLPQLLITGDLAIVRDRLPYGGYFPTLWAYDYNMNYDLYLMDVMRYPNNASLVAP